MVGDRFFIKRRGIWAATPLFLTLIVVESSDVIFAVDSIPAVLAVTTDPFIVYSSNVFAIMGLRSLYYLLAHVNLFGAWRLTNALLPLLRQSPAPRIVHVSSGAGSWRTRGSARR